MVEILKKCLIYIQIYIFFPTLPGNGLKKMGMDWFLCSNFLLEHSNYIFISISAFYQTFIQNNTLNTSGATCGSYHTWGYFGTKLGSQGMKNVIQDDLFLPPESQIHVHFHPVVTLILRLRCWGAYTCLSTFSIIQQQDPYERPQRKRVWWLSTHHSTVMLQVCNHLSAESASFQVFFLTPILPPPRLGNANSHPPASHLAVTCPSVNWRSLTEPKSQKNKITWKKCPDVLLILYSLITSFFSCIVLSSIKYSVPPVCKKFYGSAMKKTKMIALLSLGLIFMINSLFFISSIQFFLKNFKA